MGEFFEQIPDFIKEHIKEITKTSGLPNDEESLEKISIGWLEKKKTFEEEISKMDMEEIEDFKNDDSRGALAMTYSGSLINIGPLVDGVRKSAYASIGLRRDVPDMVTKEGCILSSDICLNEPLEFEVGPVKKTSAIFKIVVCSEKLSASEQEEKISDATVVIMDEFVEVNKTLIDE